MFKKIAIGVNMKKIFIALFILTISFSTVFANESKIERYKLKSGQNVVIKEVHDHPAVIIDTWIKTGSVDETGENNGVAHFLEHLFFKGSKKYPGNSFSEITDSKGGITNAATSKDYTHYYIEIPSQYFETAMDLHADMLLNPLIPPDELEKERLVVIREISMTKDNPYRILYNNMFKRFYPTHPYGREVIGTEKIISSIPREEIFKFYDKNYSPSNMTTIVVGDIKSKEVLKSINKHFGKKTSVKSVRNKYKIDSAPFKQTEETVYKDINTGYIIIGFKSTPFVNSKDAYALEILSEILSGGKNSRFYKNLKEPGIVKSSGASFDIYARDTLFTVYADFDPKKLQNVKASIFEEIKNTVNISEKEVEMAKKILERAMLFGRETIAGTASELGYFSILSDDDSFYDNYLNNLKNITVSDVQNAAKKYLIPEKSVITVLLPEKPVNVPVSTVTKNEDKTIEPGELFEASESNTLPCETKSGIQKYILKNGAALLIQKSDKNEVIAINIKIKGGNYTEEIKGTGRITANVLTEGTKKYPGNNFSYIAEENGIQISANAEDEFFNISVKCLSENLSLALDLLREMLLYPEIKSTDVEKAKNDILYAILKNKDIPSYTAFDILEGEIWKNTPYDNSSEVLKKSLPAIKTSDVAEFAKNLINPGNTVISVNGNVNERKIAGFFEAIPSFNNSCEIDLRKFKNSFKEIPENKTVTQKQNTDSAQVIIAVLTEGKTSEKDRQTLNVINSILGAGMSSRLFTKIREQNGLAYSVSSGFSAGINKGMFYLYASCAKDKIDTVLKYMNEETELLKNTPVGEKELQDAKSKLIGNLILGTETNLQKASLAATGEVSYDGYDYFSKVPELINSVTAEDIREVSKKYFSKNKVTVILKK